MLTPIHSNNKDSLFPDQFKNLISSHVSGKRLEASIIDIQPCLNSDDTEMVTHWLTDEEKIQFSRYSFEKRRSEWLSGRICAKQSVLFLSRANNTPPVHPHDFSIKATGNGRPFIHFTSPVKGLQPIEISISHSHGKAVGIASDEYCGVDVQRLNNTLFKVRERFCTDVEMAVLDEIPADELVHLGLLWVAKEALRKCLSGIRLAGFNELQLVQACEIEGYFMLSFLPDIPEISFRTQNHLQVIAHHADNFAIAVATIAKGSIDA